MRQLSTVLVLSLGLASTPLVAAPLDEEVAIPAEHHPFAEELRAWIRVPAGATADDPVPACLILHGSGGLFRDAPQYGEVCDSSIDTDFRTLAELLADAGVAALLPESFASRDPRFCEDNDPGFFAYAAPPLLNPGDAPQRDSAYKRRRIVVRSLDLLAATGWLCTREEIDCSRLCLIGASNGSTSALSYVAQDLERHMDEFLDSGEQRTHESIADHEARQTAFAHLPALPPLADRLAVRPLPKFVHAIAPGCGLRDLVPSIVPTDPGFDPDLHLTDLYYPESGVQLHLEIGTADSVPEECYGDGFRAVQAAAFEQLTGMPSRYHVNLWPGLGHDLLDEVPQGVHANLLRLVDLHFFPEIFADGLEARDSK